jgi:agmatinase
MGMRAIVDVLGAVVAHGKMGSHRHMIRGWGA